MNKWLYEFKSFEIVKKDDGSTNKIEHNFALLKPNRRMREEADLFYAAETSRFAKAGVLPKAAWNTILSNGGGSISENDREVYGQLLLKFRDLSFELQSILIKGESEKSEKEKARVDELTSELEDIRKEIHSFETSQISIFENTAEAKARNRAILWWILHIAYQKNDQEYLPIFNGESFSDKLSMYDNYEDNEDKYEFILGVIRRITYLITLWFLGRAESEDDFKNYDKAFLKDTEEPSESKKEEEPLQEVNNIQEIVEIKPE
jgi:hypothetical protein